MYKKWLLRRIFVQNMNMKITLEATSPSKYLCKNEKGQSINLSGDKSSVGPMESVLMAAAGCSTVDIEIILEKMRQKLEKIEVEVEAQRAETTPKVFTSVKLHYILTGDLKEEKVEKAIDMSVNEYCSVLTMIAKTATIETSFEIKN